MGILQKVVCHMGITQVVNINTTQDIFEQVNQNKSIYNEVHLTNIFCFYRKWENKSKIIIKSILIRRTELWLVCIISP